MLTDTAIRNAKPKDKNYKLTDALGLYLIVTTAGGKWWRVDYRLGGKRKTLSLGTYPQTSLVEARAERDRLRKNLKEGVDPSLQRRVEAIRSDASDSFEFVAREWHSKKSSGWSGIYSTRTIERFERDVFPYIGGMPISSIDAPTLLAVLRRMEARGVTELVLRVRENCGAVFRYAIATGRCSSDPAAALRGALASAQVKHHSAITDPKRFGRLLLDIDQYEGSFVVRCALKLSPLLALRPGELRNLEWAEIHLDTREIRIPASKMKMKTDHIVPLATQAIAIFVELHRLTGNGKYAFPSSRSPKGDRGISENTVNVALRSLGYEKETMCAHGFRGSFCSIANERLNFSSDAIERQLAHAERNKVRAAYLHGEFMDERIRLMQTWADYLDELRVTANNVVQMRAIN